MKNIEENDYEAYLRGEDSYLETWKNMKELNQTRFNFYAFFFGMFWLLYRKMYTVTLLLFALLLVVSTTQHIVLKALKIDEGMERIISYVINILLSVLLGKYANKLYLWEAARRIRRVQALGLPEDEHYAEIYKRGGNTLMPFIILAAFILIVLLFYTF